MFRKALDYLRRFSAPKEIEDSRRFRIAVWAAVSVSFFALAFQKITSTSLVMAAVILISLGYYVSWRRRRKRNLAIKTVIVVLTLAALASFLRQVYLQPYDPRIPLAELFIWVQVLHSYDLPRRKDLLLSLISSLILLSLAGSFAQSASFAWLILLYLAAALPSLYFAQLSRLRSLSSSPERAAQPPPSLRRLLPVLVFLLLSISLAGLAIGACMPRPSVPYMRSLPFSLRRAFNLWDGFKLTNPGYPDLPTKPPPNAMGVNPRAYFGFSTFLDLRARGKLVDLPVMKVRSTEPAYWRGLSFRDYNGYSWMTAGEEPELLHASVQPFTIAHNPDEVRLSSRQIVQTFYIESEEPNIVFAAQRPSLVYFPSDYLFQDSSGLKSPYTLSDGLVYSVISDGGVPEGLMAAVTGEAGEEFLRPYLEVPPLPERVTNLVEKIVPEDAGPYERAQAVEDFLKSEYDYSLDVPLLPAGEDALDVFLFEHRRGYCEHFATAYAILCRLAGIPSRVITGYSTGDYNPFTGLYEVSLADAHAWVEIYLHGIGWVTREPTPGFSQPDPGEGAGSLWIFGDLFSWVGDRLSSLLPGPLRSALKTGFSAIASAAVALVSGLTYSVRHAPWLPPLLLLLVLLCALFFLAARRTRREPPDSAGLDEAVLAMREFLEALDSLGLRRDPSQTAGEYADGLCVVVPGLSLSGELRLFEQARYGIPPLPPEDIRRLRDGLSRALDEIRRHLKRRR